MRDPIWKTCTGEAHGNAHIDNCGICRPFWGVYPTCPDCGERLDKGGGGMGLCPNQDCEGFRYQFDLRRS